MNRGGFNPFRDTTGTGTPPEGSGEPRTTPAPAQPRSGAAGPTDMSATIRAAARRGGPTPDGSAVTPPPAPVVTERKH